MRGVRTIAVRAAFGAVFWVHAGCATPHAPNIGPALLDDAQRVDETWVGTGEHEQLALARRDPLAFLRRCIDHYDQAISDYRCTFVVRERLRGALGPGQVMRIVFRERPFSVDVRWVSGSVGAERVTYVAGRHVRGDKELAYVKPSGVLGLLMPAGVMRHIHAGDVAAAARRPIDEFGFRHTLALFVSACERAMGAAEYELVFVGVERFDGHPCYVLERRLPYAASAETFPDRLQRMYIDTDWLIPRACFAYSDDRGEHLLGSYIARDIEFNVGVNEDAFNPSRRLHGSGGG